ncbi:hypothetical protein CSC70_08880 [Pseudoxanthomonas kalamensis DSM 18571]|uniref:hypothetical protein n=1 Tax=Pseudoxanthomonas kalamensis TaxID=289483 RepID=UPI001391FC53|nr:hypothetical protein [Pseudoxanthomonas kalamensis]KAF1709802.1 hypothetical protein CSC70_08880 [Pseudoxanthomonas kalamensis DSM 18571]
MSLPLRPLFCLFSALLPAAPVLARDASVEARLDARGVKYVLDEDGDYKVTYSYSSEGRTQLVFVSGGTESVDGFAIREVFSPAARVADDGIDGARALALLAESRASKLGSWEIGGDILYFVIKLPDGVSAVELEQAMDIAAQTADDMEIELSGDKDDL